MPYLAHPEIETPPDETVIWRYLDLGRFLSLLQKDALFLSRVDRFPDSWEGNWPQPLIKSLDPLNEVGLGRWAQSARKCFFVSCWHESDIESAALWDLYARSGVAIQSSVRSLRESVRDGKIYYIGRVKYEDFSKFQPVLGDAIFAPFLKRKSFIHESEIRLLHQDIPHLEKFDEAVASHELAVDLNVLIERLYISPVVESWIELAIREVCARFDLRVEIVRSRLYDAQIV